MADAVAIKLAKERLCNWLDERSPSSRIWTLDDGADAILVEVAQIVGETDKSCHEAQGRAEDFKEAAKDAEYEFAWLQKSVRLAMNHAKDEEDLRARLWKLVR